MIERRALLTVTAAAATSGTLRRALAASLDVESPAGRLRVFMMLRGALDGRLVIGGSQGVYSGIVDAQVTPLFGFVSATFARYRRMPNGGYEGAVYEVPFFTDLATGALLERWQNPYTGETLSVPQPSLPPARIRYAPDLSFSVLSPPPGMTLTHSVTPPTVSGDDVWIVEETVATFRIPGQPAPAHFTEIVTLHANRASLAVDGAARVRCVATYQGIGGWRRWQKMGARPGSLFGNGYGRYGTTLAELPNAWRVIAEARRPEVLRAPEAVLK